MTETMKPTEAPKARPTGPKMQTTANEIAVDIVAMHKWYGDFHVLRDINLRVKRGERICAMIVRDGTTRIAHQPRR